MDVHVGLECKVRCTAKRVSQAAAPWYHAASVICALSGLGRWVVEATLLKRLEAEVTNELQL